MWTKRRVYTYSIVLPVIVMSIVFACLGVFPFGKNTVMAIDFASQYIDLFAFFKRTISQLDFSGFFYSFSKSLGGDMVGVWGYYLLSPFNLIYLLFPYDWLSVAATLTILARYAAMGFTFSYFIIRRYNALEKRPFLIPIFAMVYALTGHNVAYQMNPLWYDAMIMLPLVITGVEEVLDGNKKAYKYSILLALSILLQYYMSYMMCLFIIIYALYYLCRKNWIVKKKLYALVRLAVYSFIAVGLSAILLYPIVQNLLLSKGTYTEPLVFRWEWSFNPLDILSKTMIGAFDYDQMPKGLPNVYVASFSFISFLVFFFMKEFKWQERMAGLVVMLIFIVSMAHDFTNKIWHLGQTPAWFFHRFTYLTAFFIVITAYRAVRNISVLSLKTVVSICVLIIFINIATYYQHASYMTIIQQVVSTLLWLLAVVFLYTHKTKLMWVLMCLIAIIEVGVNAHLVQSKIGYANTYTFANAYQVINEAIEPIRPTTSEFYRISKMFNRGKNDPFMHNYPGLTHFSSNMESKTMDLFDNMGDAGSNAATNYGTGTPLTDALYGVKYVVQLRNLPQEQKNNITTYAFTRESTRKDLYSYYTAISETDRTRTYRNDNVLSIAFGVNQSVIDLELKANNPVYNQNMILQALDNSITEEGYLTSYGFSNITLNNFETDNPNNLSSVSLKRIDNTQPASITYTFTPQTDDIYYISVPATLNESKSDLKLTLNGQAYEYYVRFDHRQLFNVADNNKGQEIKFEISTQTLDKLNIFNVEVVRLNKAKVNEVISKRKKQEMKVSQWRNNVVEGQVEITDDSTYLMTTIPYSKGWHAYVDNQKVETLEIWNSLMAVPISSGYHTIKFEYIPYGLNVGIMISIVSSVLLPLMQLSEKYWRKNEVI